MEILNAESPLPLYHQLADILISKIRTGVYSPGEKLPSETGLASEYKIGRPTVRQAVEILVRKGLVNKKRGSGTFVCHAEDEVDLFSLAGTSSAFTSKGIAIDIRILKEVSLETVPLDSDNPFSGEKAYFFSRLTTARKEPVLIEDFYLDSIFFQGIEDLDLTGKSLSNVVSDTFYMKPVGGKQHFSICFLSDTRAALLNVTGEVPVLQVKRFLNFSQGDNAVYSEILCRTDRFVFSQDIGGGI